MIPLNKDLPGTMKIRSYNGGSLFSEVILHGSYSAWVTGKRSLLGGLLFGGFTVLSSDDKTLNNAFCSLGPARLPPAADGPVHGGRQPPGTGGAHRRGPALAAAHKHRSTGRLDCLENL